MILPIVAVLSNRGPGILCERQRTTIRSGESRLLAVPIASALDSPSASAIAISRTGTLLTASGSKPSTTSCLEKWQGRRQEGQPRDRGYPEYRTCYYRNTIFLGQKTEPGTEFVYSSSSSELLDSLDDGGVRYPHSWHALSTSSVARGALPSKSRQSVSAWPSTHSSQCSQPI